MLRARPMATPAAVSDVDVARLRDSIGRLARYLRAIDAGSGLTPTQMSLLASLVRLGPVRMSDLAKRERLNVTLLSRAVAGLEDNGLVARTVDPADKRASTIAITRAGTQLLRRLRSARSDLLRSHVGSLNVRDQKRLVAVLPVLDQLVERLNA
jgi:DNA-binding MarR family transcriptional regulator